MNSRICFIIPEYNSATPTHFNYIYGLLDALQKNFDIFLIIEKGGKPDFLKNNNYYVQRFKFLPFRIVENALIILYARFKGYCDFYIHYSFLSAFNASTTVKIFGGRTFHWNCGLPWLYKRNFIRNLFERIVYKLITFLVTGTESLRKQYSFHYCLPLTKIKVMPNLIDCDRFSDAFFARNEMRNRLNISLGSRVILFAHCLSKRKGADHLPEIIKGFKGEDVILVIAGHGAERGMIESKIKNDGLQDKVRFLGWIPNAEIQKYFGMADVFILPSEEEGFPHVVLEAMASSLPVVAFDVGGVKDIVPPEFSEYIAVAGDISGFTRRIKKISGLSEIELKKIKNIGLDWVKNFDMKLAVEKFKDLLQYR